MTRAATGWLSALASAAMLAALLWLVPLGRLVAVLREADGARLAGAVVAAAVAWALMGAKWRALLPEAIAPGAAQEISIRALFYGFVLPGQLAGDAFRALVLARTGGLGEALATVALDRALGLIALLALGLAGALGSERLAASAFAPLTIAALAGLLAAAIAAVTLALAWARRPHASATHAGWLRRHLDALAVAAGKVRGRDALLCFVLSLAFQAACIVEVDLLARALGVVVAWRDWAWIFAFASIVLLLPFTLGGLGVREGAFVALLAAIGVAPERALGCALLLSGVTALGAAAGALLELRALRRRLRRPAS